MKRTLSLNQNTLFRRLYYRGKTYHSRIAVLHVLPNRSPVNRLGLTVGKKVGNAVTRNRVRRLLREAYRLREESLKTGFDLVLVAKAEAVGKSFSEVDSNVFYLLRKAQLMNSEDDETTVT